VVVTIIEAGIPKKVKFLVVLFDISATYEMVQIHVKMCQCLDVNKCNKKQRHF